LEKRRGDDFKIIKIQLFTTMSMTGIKSKMMLAVCNNIALLFKKIKGYNIKHINKR
jgi:hypothetical protein